MNSLILFIAAVLPAALLFLYIYGKDRIPEPTPWLWRSVLCGILIAVPVSFTEMFISDLFFGENTPTTLFGTTTEAFLVAALPEESFKLLVLWLLLRNNPYFDEHFDGIVYSVCVGLGFAAIENVMYIFQYSDQWQSIAITRALLAVPGHYAFAVMMGYYYSMYHFVEKSLKNKVSILLVPILAHGTYDALALSGQVDPFLGSISFFVLIYFCIKMHKLCKWRVVAVIEMDQDRNLS